MTWPRVGNRVIVQGPPPDVEDSYTDAIHLFRGLRGVVTDIWSSRTHSGTYYRIHLDDDLEAASQHGLIVNDYVIEARHIQPEQATIEEAPIP